MSNKENEIEDLITELGLEKDEENQKDNADIKEVSDIDSSVQLQASEKLINTCKDIYQKGRENDLAWRWMIGQQINDAYDNEEKYESSILKRASDELDISISDLSRFRKFYLSFNKELIIERAQVGYTWSHFKIVNDLPDDDVKKRMIAQIEKEDEAPKIKDLQQTITEEKNSQFSGLDEDGSSGLGGSTGDSQSKGPSPIKPVNGALKHVEKLVDFLTDILIQENAGIDFDTDAKQDKYDEYMEELGIKVLEINDIYEKIWKDAGNNTDDEL